MAAVFNERLLSAPAVFSGSVRRLVLFAFVLLTVLWPATGAQAGPWSARGNINVASMLSKDQVEKLGFDSVGFLGGVALSRKFLTWLSAQWWVRGGAFLPKERIDRKGGLLGTTLGVRVHSSEREVVPYLSFDAGACVTGSYFRPWYGASVGVDWRVREWLKLGPTAGFDQVIQWNKQGYSTDAIYFWLGMSFAYDTDLPKRAPQKPKPVLLPPAPPPEPAPEPSDTRELETLIERTLGPSQSASRLELLAPVLFALDSDQLEPIGVAMLHEVANVLRTRQDIRLLEIQGYADARGNEQHNQELSGRRATRVRDWLIEHGVESERLVVAAHGASSPVEAEGTEQAHEQNRRVIFRVLEQAAP